MPAVTDVRQMGYSARLHESPFITVSLGAESPISDWLLRTPNTGATGSFYDELWYRRGRLLALACGVVVVIQTCIERARMRDKPIREMPPRSIVIDAF